MSKPRTELQKRTLQFRNDQRKLNAIIPTILEMSKSAGLPPPKYMPELAVYKARLQALLTARFEQYKKAVEEERAAELLRHKYAQKNIFDQ